MKAGLTIGELQFNNPFLLAPLAGFTDKTMRALCAEQGASLTFTEMVSAKGLKYGDRKTRQLLELEESDNPTGYQIFGSEPVILMEAAEELADCDNAVLDLNCGCPVPKIVKNGEGSALLRDIDRLYECVAAMVIGAQKGAGADPEWNRKPKPVTAKIRMGFEQGENVAVEAARAIEAAGASAITVHGRTRQQFYEGRADWHVIAEVKKAVNIPVIGNGDIRCGQDAIRMMDETDCDAVMIARGALGNPWIFREAVALWEADWHSGQATAGMQGDLCASNGSLCASGSFCASGSLYASNGSLCASGGLCASNGSLCASPNDDERINMLIRHIEMVCADKGEGIGVREMRKFVGHYTRGMHGATALRRKVNSIDSKTELIEAIRSNW